MSHQPKVIAISGGIGGAKLALGLYEVLGSDELTVVCNTGDDFEHMGFTICPDIDTVMYTLAGVANPDVGWGRADESWQFMQAWAALGGEIWFNIGDKDLATHVIRSEKLNSGVSLTQVCEFFSNEFNISACVLPAADAPIRTQVLTASGSLPFQEYFVRDRCEPVVTGFEFEGAAEARVSETLRAHLHSERLEAIVICPSNPYISIDPVLAVPGLRDLLKDNPAPVVAVSPIIGSAAVKGPTAKMMHELGTPVTAKSIASHYGEILDGFVIDSAESTVDAEFDLAVSRSDILMRSIEDKRAVAKHVLGFAAALTR